MLEIGEEGAGIEDLLVTAFIHRRAQQNVAAHRLVQNEGRLSKVCDTTLQLHMTAGRRGGHLAE